MRLLDARHSVQTNLCGENCVHRIEQRMFPVDAVDCCASACILAKLSESFSNSGERTVEFGAKCGRRDDVKRQSTQQPPDLYWFTTLSRVLHVAGKQSQHLPRVFGLQRTSHRLRNGAKHWLKLSVIPAHDALKLQAQSQCANYRAGSGSGMLGKHRAHSQLDDGEQIVNPTRIHQLALVLPQLAA